MSLYGGRGSVMLVPGVVRLLLLAARPRRPHSQPDIGESLRVTASPTAVDLALAAAQAAADKSAHDVRILDVSEQLVITDCFVLASAPNERLVRAISDEVQDRLRERGVKPVRREGESEGRWVLLDFVDLVVHVQHAEERAFYQLERLWKDCPEVPFVDAALAGAPAGAGGQGSSARVGDES